MSKTSRRLLLIGVLFFVVGIVASFPARIAYRWFAPDTLLLAGIEGTVWSGAAEVANVGGLPLADAQWNWRALALFKGGIGYDIEARPAGGTLTGTVVVGISGNVSVSELKGVVNLAEINDIVGVPGLGGLARADFTLLTLVDGFPDRADGIIEVSNLLLPVISDVRLGGFKSEWFNEEDGLVGVIEDTTGAVDIAGRVLVREDRSYSLLAQVSAKAETPTAIRRNLNSLGPANARGQRELRLEGVL